MTDATNRLRLLSDVGRALATFTELDDLVQYATSRTRELFDAGGCALLLLDPERRELYFPVASQRDCDAASSAQLAEIRFPAERGVAGWVLAHNEPTLVADTSTDERFYDAIDDRTAMRTHSLLCAPLRTRTGCIGVIEVVNPGAAMVNSDHLEFLDTLASEIGVAYEKAALYRELEGEVLDLRRFCRWAGLVLAVAGAALGLAAALYHRARVLPWSELFTRRGMIVALICLAIGALLLAVGKGWIVPARARGRS
ncbi:MAG: GAF domain-containing protein [Candidatus Binatia bacterium]